MVPDSMMKGIVASYLASPQGMKMIHAYLSPADGQTSIRKYLATPEGKQTVQLLLPPMLDGLNLLEDVKEKIRIANSEKT
ncbi:MAG: hypothetical protein NTZ37_07625 [Methanoregula sp.]|nr:hypothetical protein [Methanoregula sp.]